MPDRLGDQQVGQAVYDALVATLNMAGSVLPDRQSPFWIEVAWKLSEAGLKVESKGPGDV